MTKLRLLLAAGALLVLGVAGSAAIAAPPGTYTCAGGEIPSGTYRSLTVDGACTLGGDLTVDGNVRIARGASLNDHAASGAMVTVHGNVLVGPGGVLGLGDYNPFGSHESSIVDGNVVASQPLSLYLGDMTIRGNLVSNGGGGEAAIARSFPIKDNTINGNLIVRGWQGTWIGLLGNDVGGNVIFSNNSSAIGVTPQAPDSSEVVSNDVGGNLICLDNTPPAQIGDADPPDGFRGPNTVSGNTIGECTDLPT